MYDTTHLQNLVYSQDTISVPMLDFVSRKGGNVHRAEFATSEDRDAFIDKHRARVATHLVTGKDGIQKLEPKLEHSQWHNCPFSSPVFERPGDWCYFNAYQVWRTKASHEAILRKREAQQAAEAK